MTGDSTIASVTDGWCPVEEVRTYEFSEVSLAGMALLRRISILPGVMATKHACEEVLIAANVNPEQTLVRLRGLDMFSPTAPSDKRVLSQKAIDGAQQFSLWLTYDPRLVAAYRKVTYQIDKTIRFDGKPLFYAAPSQWVPPGSAGAL